MNLSCVKTNTIILILSYGSSSQSYNSVLLSEWFLKLSSVMDISIPCQFPPHQAELSQASR